MRFALAIIILSMLACTTGKTQEKAKTAPLPDCEWCGAMDAPANLSWEYQIADEQESGDRLILEGRVYRSDGRTLAEGILLYAYHTDSNGIYAKKGDEKGNGRRHGYLRGWILTNSEGRYRFETIKPEPYPSRNEPAHVHLTISSPDFEEYWISSTLFEGDSLITPEIRKRQNSVPEGSGIISLAVKNGKLHGIRDIRLK